MKKINEIIRDFREDNDLSQLEVSKHLNIPRSTYSRYENGNSKIPIDIILQLSKLYKVSPNILLGYSKDFPELDIAKLDKLCKYISKENIDIDKLIDLINLSKNINK